MKTTPLSRSAARFVSNYADNQLYEAGKPTGMCADCQHHRPATINSEKDWCWLKEGAFAEGREEECPAWISSRTIKEHAPSPAGASVDSSENIAAFFEGEK